MSILAKNRRSSGKWGTKNIFFSLSKKLVLSIIVVKLDFMCQIQKMYYGYCSISINFRPQYLVFSSKMFGYGSVTVRPFLLWFGFGSAEHEKSLFGRPLLLMHALRMRALIAEYSWDSSVSTVVDNVNCGVNFGSFNGDRCSAIDVNLNLLIQL